MRLSVQLYTVRDQLAKDVRGTLSQLRDFGLEYVEGGGTYGTETAEEAKALLDELGLKACSSHVGLHPLETNLEKAIHEAKILGGKYMVISWLSSDVYANGWEVVGERITPIAQKIKDEGLQLGYHNHAFEFENEGKPGLEVLFDTTDPELLVSELDIAWVSIGGADPVKLIEKLKGRIPLVHLKDYDPAKKPQWQPGGKGIIDWDACLAACKDANVEFGSIELDESEGDPMEAVRESVRFFQSNGIS